LNTLFVTSTERRNLQNYDYDDDDDDNNNNNNNTGIVVPVRAIKA